ncbi:Flp pilus assembly protein CpaB [Paludibacterium purpuratum]|uniref:Pilus assembly protein CpaB n=1 Tax=Paludibacterium purpuratum TaxID=1144873 RepID=A0A4V3DVA6_9NEIS|nr:Flp pilus assembly protein CpaB [Paludibacterium purpuratum]TDR80249.1 pilus assembly protein CpaB [Paludibacterium purpuratum]
MKSSQKNILLLLILAVVAAIGVRIFMANNAAHQVAAPVKVLVAHSDLTIGTLLRQSDLSWKEIPASELPKNAVEQSSDTAKTMSGALLRNAVKEGDPILSTDVISPNAPEFLAAALAPGMRAVSVAITDVSGNAGLIQPGDRVDLLLTQNLRDEKSPAHSVVAETIATDLRVIAVGSSFQRPKEGDSQQANLQARTITFEVTPIAAQAVTVASHLGDLSLALKSFAKTSADGNASAPMQQAQKKWSSSAPSDGPIWAGDISQAVRAEPKEKPAAAPAAPANRAPSATGGSVRVLRGSTEGTATPTAALPLAMPIGNSAPTKLQ